MLMKFNAVFMERLGIALVPLAFLPGCMNGRSPAVLAGGALCEEPAWFVGSVDPQVQRHFSHTFVLHNQTDKSIPIAQVKPDCACLVSENLPKAIPARSS